MEANVCCVLDDDTLKGRDHEDQGNETQLAPGPRADPGSDESSQMDETNERAGSGMHVQQLHHGM